MCLSPICRPAAAGLVMLAVAGCGGVSTDYYKVDLMSVGGTIMLDGKPVSGGEVRFEAPDRTYSSSPIDGGGRYTLQFDSVKAGVTPGPKTVRITGRGPVGEREAGGEGSEAASAGGGETVPACYNKDSKLKVEVTGSATMDFDLKSDCSVTGPTG